MYANAPLEIVLTFFGILIDFKLFVEKELGPISSNELGKLILSRLLS